MRKSANRTIRLPRIPMGSVLRDQFRLQLHTSLSALKTAPSTDAFDGLAEIFNVVGWALRDDAQHSREANVIEVGAAALNRIENHVFLTQRIAETEIATITAAVNEIDNLLGRLDVSKLYLAMRELRAMGEVA
jgi:hypothetical protein